MNGIKQYNRDLEYWLQLGDKVRADLKRTAIVDNETLTGYTSDGVEITYDGLNFRDENGFIVFIGGPVRWIDLED